MSGKCSACGRGDWFGEFFAPLVIMAVLAAAGFCVAAGLDGLTARLCELHEPLPTAPAPIHRGR